MTTVRKRLGSISHAAVSDALFFTFKDLFAALLVGIAPSWALSGAPDWGGGTRTQLQIPLDTGGEEAFHVILDANNVGTVLVKLTLELSVDASKVQLQLGGVLHLDVLSYEVPALLQSVLGAR